MLALDDVTEDPDVIDGSAHPEDEALSLLISRAIKRGDLKMARDLAAVPARSEEDLHVMVSADCPVLTRIATVCDPIETLAWRRALVHAGVRNDGPRINALLELAARRCLE